MSLAESCDTEEQSDSSLDKHDDDGDDDDLGEMEGSTLASVAAQVCAMISDFVFCKSALKFTRVSYA